MVKLTPIAKLFGEDADEVEEGDEFVARVRHVEGRKIAELFSKAELAIYAISFRG